MRITLHEKYDENEESFVIGEHTRKKTSFWKGKNIQFCRKESKNNCYKDTCYLCYKLF